jgi:hypothetical protein
MSAALREAPCSRCRAKSWHAGTCIADISRRAAPKISMKVAQCGENYKFLISRSVELTLVVRTNAVDAAGWSPGLR